MLSQFVKKAEIVAYEDLGTEAIRAAGGRAVSRPSCSTTVTAVTYSLTGAVAS